MVNLEQAIQVSIQSLKKLPLDLSQLSFIENKISTKQFNLVVIGQFKRGKSTLINALIGKDILPTSVLPLTSIVTIINYGEKEETLVRFSDGSIKNILTSDIGLYVTEEHNPNNKLNVENVEIYYPADFLKDSIKIIDTPGIGSVYEHNSDVSYKFLPKADASLFILSPDPPITHSEIEFLSDAKKYIDKFFFLLNKIDNFKPNELEKVLEFNKSILEHALSQTINIIPLSAKLALEAVLEKDENTLEQSNISTLFTELNNFMRKEQENVLWVSIINSLLRYIDTQMSLLKLNSTSLSMDQATLKEKIKLFEEALEKLEIDEYTYWLEKKTNNIINTLDDDILLLKKQEIPKVVSKINNFFDTLKTSSTSRLNEQLKSYLSDIIQENFSAFLKDESVKIGDTIEELYNQLLDKINTLIENITKTASDIFEVALTKITQVEKLSEKSEFYFLIQEQPGALDMINDFFKSKLPLFLGKKVIYNSIKERSVELFDRHCGRARYDFIKRIKETSLRLKSQVEEKLNQTIETIKNILNTALLQQNDPKKQQQLNLIQDNLNALLSIKNDLENLKKHIQNHGTV